MASLQDQIHELNSYPSCAHVSPQKLAAIFGQLQSANGTLEQINIGDIDDVTSKLSTLTHAGNYAMYTVKGGDGKFPSSVSAMLMPKNVYERLHLYTPQKAIVQLKQNWEVYYKVAGRWYSQNIRKYLRPELVDVPHPVRTGDLLIVGLHEVLAVDLLDTLVDFSTLDISGSLSILEKATWEAYKLSIGCGGLSDEDTIKAMLNFGMLYSQAGDSDYELIPQRVLMYDFILIRNEQQPLTIFKGDFNSGNDCDLPGIYNKIVLGRPPGSVSGETYTLITHPDGSQEVHSNTIAGKAFYRTTKMDEWVQLGIN